MMKRTVLVLLSLLALLALAACGGDKTTPAASNAAPESAIITLNGAGATFPLPVYTEWNQMYRTVQPDVTINYQGIGSGGGQKAILDGTVDFAGSDSLLKENQYEKMPDLQMLPMLAGAVVPIYNIPQIEKLVLDGPTLVAIFDATITNWSDPAIAALNPGVTLPDQPITVVHRSDGSGTTEIFTSYLGAVSEDWKNNVGVGQAIQWPADASGQGIGGKGNPGVAQAVQSTPYAIGYVELDYAKSNDIPTAALVNAAGNEVTASAETMQDAMAAFANAFDERLTATIVNAPGENSWPIMGYTYLIIHMTDNTDCAETKALVDYIHWAISDEAAAQKAEALGYATLPGPVQALVSDKLAGVQCNGAPLK